MSNQNDYIGKSIYVITKAEVRYEGTLIDVDREKKIMSLKNVSQKGTEGRRNGENEIPPNDTILGMVKFKVELIKEFNIISQPEEDDEVDPAILEQQESQKEQSNKNDDWSRGQKPVKTNEETQENDSKTVEESPSSGGYQPGPRSTNQAQKEGDSSQNEEEQKQKPQEKPKYQKNDFFDSLTNSTLEVRPQRGNRGGYRGGDRGGGRGGYQNDRGGGYQNDRRGGEEGQNNYRGGGRGRGYSNWNNNNEGEGGQRTEYRGGGGYRGRGRANFHQAPNDTETFGDAGKEQMSWQRNDNDRNNFRSDGQGGGNRGNYRNNNRGSTGGEYYKNDRRTNHTQKFSDTLQDPNDVNYNEGQKMEGEQQPSQEKSSFFDNNNRRGGGRGGRGRGGGNGGGYRNNVRDENKDAETFGEGMASNFQYENSNYRGGGGNRGGNRGGYGNRNNNNNRGDNRDNHNEMKNNDRKNDPYKKSYNESQKNFKQERVTDDGHKGFFDVPKNKTQQASKRNTNRFAGLEESTKSINKAAAAREAVVAGSEEESGGEEESKTNVDAENVENTQKV